MIYLAFNKQKNKGTLKKTRYAYRQAEHIYVAVVACTSNFKNGRQRKEDQGQHELHSETLSRKTK
jgi:hypothetical protein